LATTTTPLSESTTVSPSTRTVNFDGLQLLICRRIEGTYERWEIRLPRRAARSCTTAASKPTDVISRESSPCTDATSTCLTSERPRAASRRGIEAVMPNSRAKRFSFPEGQW